MVRKTQKRKKKKKELSYELRSCSVLTDCCSPAAALGRSPNPRCWPERMASEYGSVPGRARRQGQGTGQGEPGKPAAPAQSKSDGLARDTACGPFSRRGGPGLETASPIPAGRRPALCRKRPEGRQPRGCCRPAGGQGPGHRPGAALAGAGRQRQAIEVGRVGGRLVLLAERGRGQDRTALRWQGRVLLDRPLSAPFRTVDWPAVDPVGPRARPVSALTLDRAGRIYPRPMIGRERPFAAIVWRIGVLAWTGTAHRKQVRLVEPVRIAHPGRLQGRGLASRPTPEAARTAVRRHRRQALYGGILPAAARTRLNAFPAGARPCPTPGRPGLFIAAATVLVVLPRPNTLYIVAASRPRAGTAAGLVSCLGVLLPPWCT